MKITMYGSFICQDCIYAVCKLKDEGIEIESDKIITIKKYINIFTNNRTAKRIKISDLEVGQLTGLEGEFTMTKRQREMEEKKNVLERVEWTQYWAESCDVNLPRVLMIGDSISSDIAGGKQYGFQTCLYTGEKELRKSVAEADYQVKLLAEIKKIL